MRITEKTLSTIEFITAIVVLIIVGICFSINELLGSVVTVLFFLSTIAYIAFDIRKYILMYCGFKNMVDDFVDDFGIFDKNADKLTEDKNIGGNIEKK